MCTIYVLFYFQGSLNDEKKRNVSSFTGIIKVSTTFKEYHYDTPKIDENIKSQSICLVTNSDVKETIVDEQNNNKITNVKVSMQLLYVAFFSSYRHRRRRPFFSLPLFVSTSFV